MKYSTLLFCLSILLSWSTSFAAPRTLKDAKNLASQFIVKSTAFHAESSTLSYIPTAAKVTRSPQLYPSYYIFNLKDNNGFVIVSGDDNARPILAYSDKGAIQATNIPANVKYWLNVYEQEMDYLAEQTDQTLVVTTAANYGNVLVEPLLGNIEWDQDYPYNMNCPTLRGEPTVTGCGATATAMIMKKYNYPKQGTGNIDYVTYTSRISISVGLGEKYAWDKMLNSYSLFSSQANRNAVAMLMYHVGAAMEMDYGLSETGGSGASVYASLSALVNNFGYNKNMYFIDRDCCNDTEWETIIIGELKQGHPLLYTGQGKNGGHAFVCDGYTDTNFFHFNWGWGGYCNGYYVLSSLAPGSGGVGSGSGNYNDMQNILVGIQPEELGTPHSGIAIDGDMALSATTLDRNQTIKATITNAWNVTAPLKNATIGIGLFKDDSFVCSIDEHEHIYLELGYGYNRQMFSGSIPVSVANGTYQLSFYSQNEGELLPTKALHKGLRSSVWDVQITDKQLLFTRPELPMVISQPSQIIAPDKVFMNQNVSFFAEVKNEGIQFNGQMGVYIKGMEADMPEARLTIYTMIPAGKGSSIQIQNKLPRNINKPGKYQVVLTYRNQKNEWVNLDAKHGTILNVLSDGSAILEIQKENKFNVTLQDGLLSITHAKPNQLVEVFDYSGRLLQTGFTTDAGSIQFNVNQSSFLLIRQGYIMRKFVNR